MPPHLQERCSPINDPQPIDLFSSKGKEDLVFKSRRGARDESRHAPHLSLSQYLAYLYFARCNFWKIINSLENKALIVWLCFRNSGALHLENANASVRTSLLFFVCHSSVVDTKRQTVQTLWEGFLALPLFHRKMFTARLGHASITLSVYDSSGCWGFEKRTTSWRGSRLNDRNKIERKEVGPDTDTPSPLSKKKIGECAEYFHFNMNMICMGKWSIQQLISVHSQTYLPSVRFAPSRFGQIVCCVGVFVAKTYFQRHKLIWCVHRWLSIISNKQNHSLMSLVLKALAFA